MAKKLLIVDDDINTLNMLMDVFETYGYATAIVDDGEKAISLASQRFFDVVLLDFQMPKVDGLTTFKKLKEISPLTTVVMMTAYSPERLIKEAVTAGAFAIVHKPFHINELVQVMDKAANRTLILVVDDRLEDREVLADLLSQRGYQVATANSGKSALEILRKTRLDVIFLDIKMPEMDGFTTLAEIKKVREEVGVIMISAYLKDEYVKVASEKGAMACLHKPIDMQEVTGLVETIEQRERLKVQPVVLIVEDDASLLTSLKIILEQEKYKVLSAETGKEALQKARAERFDVVIMDQKLPDIKGTEVCKKIREIQPLAKTIIITGYAELDIAIEAIRAEAFDFIQKPVKPDNLLNVLRRAVATRSAK